MQRFPESCAISLQRLLNARQDRAVRCSTGKTPSRFPPICRKPDNATSLQEQVRHMRCKCARFSLPNVRIAANLDSAWLSPIQHHRVPYPSPDSPMLHICWKICPSFVLLAVLQSIRRVYRQNVTPHLQVNAKDSILRSQHSVGAGRFSDTMSFFFFIRSIRSATTV